jgi:hypothetical protein
MKKNSVLPVLLVFSVLFFLATSILDAQRLTGTIRGMVMDEGR